MKMKNNSVLNTDSFDKRRFKQILEMSENMQALSKNGQELLPTFPELLGDVWASLYKMNPRIQEEVSEGLETNQLLMGSIMNDGAFQNFREFTRLDDLSSAIGSVKFGEKTNEWLIEQEERNKELQKQLEEARKQQRELQQQQQMKEPSEGDKKKQQEAGQKLQQALQQAAQELQKGNQDLGRALAEAVQETRETKNHLKSLLSGTQAGNGEAELKKVPLRDQIVLAEKMSTNDKLKEIAEWAGRFKQIARKKQKSKYDESVERSGIIIGNQIERLMPMELAQYASPITKIDFLRRFAEGELFQYEQKGKETLGKGPVVLCLDQSGSMNDMDTQAKGFALALMSIARKQKRDFALILFSTDTKTMEYEKGKIKPHDMVELAQTFLGGGTYFDRPLKSALQVIEKSRFKKADVIFVTDGEAYLKPEFIKELNRKKREKEFSILSILLGTENAKTVKEFAEKIVKAKDFTDETSQTAFEI
ncbi:MAG TPA: VWA domain-containing protein [Sporolactobacillaceae bacterium]|nr:VWA domain-containing protein [Sporolactobacillaceae bacterium]